MRRLPVVATIRDAYGFTFTHLGGVIGLIWIPMVVLTVMGFFCVQRYYNDFIDMTASGNAAAMGPALLMMLGYFLAAMLLYAMMYVSVVELALGKRENGAVAHFAFGAAQWRMFGAILAFVGLLLSVLIPLLLIGSALPGFTAGRLSPAAGGLAFALFVLLLYGVVLTAIPRFFILLPAIAVGETAPVLRRAWSLSAGNFWRLLGLFLAIIVPFLALFIGVEIALLGQNTVPMGATPQAQVIASIIQARQILPILSGLGFLVSPPLIALVARVSVTAWRTLKDDAPTVDLLA